MGRNLNPCTPTPSMFHTAIALKVFKTRASQDLTEKHSYPTPFLKAKAATPCIRAVLLVAFGICHRASSGLMYWHSFLHRDPGRDNALKGLQTSLCSL